MLKANKDCEDSYGKHKAGERWMIYGPCDYIPAIEVEIMERRESIPLDQNEGIYVRNLSNGSVRAVIGETYMLKSDEVLWKKELPRAIEEQIAK